MTTVATAERRHDYDPDAPCFYCGDHRDAHDRISRMWERCAEKAAYFAKVTS